MVEQEDVYRRARREPYPLSPGPSAFYGPL